MKKFECPTTEEKGYTTDYCESFARGLGCKRLAECRLYLHHKNEETNGSV